MSAGNLFATRQKAVTLRTKAVSAAYTVRVGGTADNHIADRVCLLYTSPSPRDRTRSRMPSSA